VVCGGLSRSAGVESMVLMPAQSGSCCALRCGAVCCGVLLCVAACCSVLWCVAVFMLKVALYCGVSVFGAEACAMSQLQCDAV